MNTCVIFCAGGFSAVAEKTDSTDYLLAADGGLVHMEKLGLTPNGIIGDFDSLGYVPAGAQVFPVEKDDTDSMLAVRKGLSLGYRRFVIYGGLDGQRLDHTVANYQTLCFLAQQGARGYLVGNDYIVTAISNSTVSFPESASGNISVFCMGADARGVTISGLHYPLVNGRLTAHLPLGVSNHFTGAAASVSVADGTLLLMYDKTNGFPLEDERTEDHADL